MSADKGANQPSYKLLTRLLGAGFVLVLLIKLYLATVLDLYSDEVFYWLESRNFALAYSDLPFMTSLLVGIGNSFSEGSTLAVRSVFILLGSTLPFLVYWIALPFTDKRQALESAILALCLPLSGFLGLLAVPDVPLIFFGLLSIGCFERALRTNRLAFWIATGILVAAGLSTHYRFVLYPVAAVLYLLFFKNEKQHWRNPGLWLAIAIACVGFIPVLWFNLANQASSASFYFVDRHPWEFQASGLLHVFKQAALVTPPLYLILVLTVVLMWGQAKNGNRGAAMMLCFSLVNALVYLLLAPWTDATSTSIHWPLSGYFPLLVFVPASLRAFYSWASQQRSKKFAVKLILAVPTIGFAGTLTALLGVGSQAFQSSLQPLLGTGILSNKMAGWQEFSAHTRTLITTHFAGTTPVIVTDNYYTAAQLEFAGIAESALTLDRDKAISDGRFAQYRLWQKDESGLKADTGHPVLYINEDSTLFLPEKDLLLEVMCGHTDSLTLLDELSLFRGDKRFSYYFGNRLLDQSSLATGSRQSAPCPYPPRAWIDFPMAGQSVAGSIAVAGWAFNEDIGVEAVHLVIDGSRVGRVNYGKSRPDVVEVMEVVSDPNRPDLGFNFELDTASYSNGEHELSIDIVNKQGTVTNYGNRIIVFNNEAGQ